MEDGRSRPVHLLHLTDEEKQEYFSRSEKNMRRKYGARFPPLILLLMGFVGGLLFSAIIAIIGK